jgi:phage tail sheath gpL-like
LKNANNYTETWAAALDDAPAGVAAKGSILFGGRVTVSGTLNLYLGGNRVQVAVAAGAAVGDIAAAVAGAVNTASDLPVTAAANSAVAEQVDLTCRWRGETGNDIDIRVNYNFGEKLPSGLTVAVTAMSGGTANPDIATALAAIGDEQYHTVIMPYVDAGNLVALESELADRWGPLQQKEGHAFAAAAGTHAAIATLGETRNSPHLSIMGAGAGPTPPYIWAAVVGAVDAYEPDPARPRQTLHLPGILAPEEKDRYTMAERDLHLHDGVSTFIVDGGGRVLIERLITTYQTNAFGVEDISYLDVTTMRTLAYLRYSVRARIARKYPRHKLAGDGTRFSPGQAVVTPKVIRAELISLFTQWEAAGLVEDIEQFKADLIVERNQSDPNRVDAIIPPDVINQFRVFAAAVQFRL